MRKKNTSPYSSFGKELEGLPDVPDLHDHIRVLTLMAKRGAERLADSDSREFREEVRRLAREADQHLTSLIRAELDGDMGQFADHGPKLSKTFQAIVKLADSGLSNIDAELEFSKVVSDLLKRVESYESLKSSRINALSTQAVGKMIQQFEAILSKYLQPERAQQAYAELMNHYPRNAIAPEELE